MPTHETDGLHAKLYALVEQRRPKQGPRLDLSPIQVIRLGAIKLIEETLEAVTTIALPKELSPAIDQLSNAAIASSTASDIWRTSWPRWS